MEIDLHAHSTRSDGTDTPAELVAKAAAAGLAVLALTDHDTTAGWVEARHAAERHGVELVGGIEISTKNLGKSQHLLAYEPDPTAPVLTEMLEAGVESRRRRVPAMLEALAAEGIYLSKESVAEFSGGTVGRPHVADALVAAGCCSDRNDAFARFLDPGKVGYIKRYAPTIEEAIAAVVAAGGVAVVAHPWGRKSHITEDRFAELADHGLAGIEVDHEEHDADARAQLRSIARNLGLIITGSSDHHGLGKVDHDLGCNRTDVDQYERLRERLAAAGD